MQHTLVKEKQFSVLIDFKSNKEDRVKLIMDNIPIDEFQRKSIVITEDIVASSSMDNLTANFGNNLSSRIIFNLGNKEPKEIIIDQIVISYGEKTILIDEDYILDYFKLNEFVVYDSITKALKTRVINNVHSPALILKQQTIDSLLN